MSWRFRAMVLTVALACGLAPQIACSVTDEAMTQAEMDCCVNSPDYCGQMNMSCCRPVVRPELGVTIKPVQNPMPQVNIAPKPFVVAVILPDSVAGAPLGTNDHAPPHLGSSSLILRI